MPLNKGKIQVGTAGAKNQISYGNQSPTADAVPLAWNAGDIRIAAGAMGDTNIYGWRCLSGGTPGVWEEFALPFKSLEFTFPFHFGNGVADWTAVDQDLYAAPATADWQFKGEASTPPNIWPFVPNADYGPGVVLFFVDVYVRASSWAGGNKTNGIRFDLRGQDDSVITTGTIDGGAGGTGRFVPCSGSMSPVAFTGLTLSVHSHVDLGIGTDFEFGGYVSIWNQNIITPA